MPPPHLPRPTCRVDTHNKLKSLRWLLFFVFLAFLAGFSAALMVVGWLFPNFGSEQLLYLGNDSRNLSQSSPDSLIMRQTRQRTAVIYDKYKKTDKVFYSDDAHVAEAVFISSDGWAVCFLPSYFSGQEKTWEAVDYQGVLHKVERAVYESVSRLLFIKVSGEGFRVASFPDWREVKLGAWLWTAGADKWEGTVLTKFGLASAKKIFSIWKPQYFYLLADGFQSGRLVLSGKGDFLGFIDENSRLIPSWLVQGQISTLLSAQRLSYRGLPWSGYMVRGIMKEDNWQPLLGFYVTEPSAKSGALKGDVVLKINGEAIDEFNLAQQIFLAPEEFPVTVWRQGEEIEMMVKKITIIP